MKIARLATRAVVGGLFVGHGTQKLLGSFGGPGIDGTTQMMDSLGMHPPRRHAYAAGATETLAGTLFALGFATPLAAAGLIGTMITAIRKVHLRNGPWVADGGYEYNLVLIATLLAMAESGPGPLSLDHRLGVERFGTRWALAALGLGAATSAAIVEYGRRHSPAPAAEAYPAETGAETPAGVPAEEREKAQP